MLQSTINHPSNVPKIKKNLQMTKQNKHLHTGEVHYDINYNILFPLFKLMCSLS